jgi:hypothetical protein
VFLSTVSLGINANWRVMTRLSGEMKKVSTFCGVLTDFISSSQFIVHDTRGLGGMLLSSVSEVLGEGEGEVFKEMLAHGLLLVAFEGGVVPTSALASHETIFFFSVKKIYNKFFIIINNKLFAPL